MIYDRGNLIVIKDTDTGIKYFDEIKVATESVLFVGDHDGDILTNTNILTENFKIVFNRLDNKYEIKSDIFELHYGSNLQLIQIWEKSKDKKSYNLVADYENGLYD